MSDIKTLEQALTTTSVVIVCGVAPSDTNIGWASTTVQESSILFSSLLLKKSPLEHKD